ncbi:hypothetical protein INT47_004419 [Mucor saturninus]|uniref:Uncharacterized protein n=1 Tax=Mucor saturninus TaxID=64648 RepID=A0A8H7V1D1_9FUNG|nr:hypothetical protein INT47_004419 [Mucor saturninus]
MAAATRQLTLADGIRYFALKKMNKMGGYLRRTWLANEKLMDDLECKMSKIQRKTGLTTPRFSASIFACGKSVDEADFKRNSQEDLDRYTYISHFYLFLIRRIAAGVDSTTITAIRYKIKKTLREMVFLEEVLNRVDCRPTNFADPLFEDYD